MGLIDFEDLTRQFIAKGLIALINYYHKFIFILHLLIKEQLIFHFIKV